MPCSFSLNAKVKAGSDRVLPSQQKRLRRQSICGRKWWANSSRTRLWMPSQARIRSACGKSATPASDSKCSSVPSPRALLQDRQQALAFQPAKAVALGADGAAAHQHVDAAPVGERVGDRRIADGIGDLEVAQGRVREHHAEAVGVVGAVALVQCYAVRRVGEFEEDRRVQPAGTAADDRDVERASRRCVRWRASSKKSLKALRFVDRRA
jgi:hypothetical protein